MKDLIRMDLYRLFHTKATKVGIIMAILVSAASMMFDLSILKVMEIASGDDPFIAITVGIVIPAANWITGTDLADIVLVGTNAFSLFIGCMVAAIFISEEQSSGYVKNVIGQLSDRSYTVISKFIVTSVAHLIILGIYTVISCVFAAVFFSQYIVSYSIGTLIGAIGLRALLFMAINAIILFLCTLTKSRSLAMVIGAIFGIGITHIVYQIASMLLGIVKIDIDIAHFMPDGINSLLSTSALGSLYIRAIAVSLVFIAGFLLGAVILVRRRDVK